jgi:hypothetical protein
LEARIDYQTARIDALYAALERHGIYPRPLTGSPGEPESDDSWEVADAPSTRERKSLPARRAAGFHLGTATGV